MIDPFALDVVAFCSLGAMSETQRIARIAVEDMAGADREKAFAETLCLVATATSRAAASAMPSDPASPQVAETVLALPVTMHAYVAGSEVLARGDETGTDHVYDTSGLERMLGFYTTQLAEGGYPDRKALRHVMILWMGRISPSGLAEHPEKRLERLRLVDSLGGHLRLIQAYVRKAAAST